MIHHLFARLNQRTLPRLVAGLLLGLAVMPLAGLADDDQASPSGRSSGGRGCGTSTMPTETGTPALILLTPNGRLGKTVSTRPTFAWFVRDQDAFPLEFRLYEQENDRFKLVKEIKDERLKSTPGIMVLSPSAAIPELTVGKRYRWQVELICNPSRPSSNIFAESAVEVVPMQPVLKTQLEQARDRLDQAKLYAQANLWYDALKAAFANPNGTAQLKAFQISLFDRVTADPMERKLLQSSPVRAIQR